MCSQKCVNTVASYYCTCANNFKLKSDNKTCQANGGDPVLMYTTSKEIKVIYLNTKLHMGIEKGLRNAVGVSFDGTNMYWTEIANGKESIMKRNQNTGRKEVGKFGKLS